MGQGLIFLNTYEAAVDLLEKRGAVYSDRSKYVMAGELYVHNHSTNSCVSLPDNSCGLSHDVSIHYPARGDLLMSFLYPDRPAPL
jgi:hypothetical protein